MFIQTEDTQEINTLRFLPGVEVSPVTTQLTKADAGRSPLADKIFDLENITRVTFGTEDIQVTKTDDAEWHTLRPQILASIMEHFMAGLPVINDTEKPSEVSPDQTEELSGTALEIQEIVNTRIDLEDRPGLQTDEGKAILELLDSQINPQVAGHGGHISLIDVKDNTAFVRLEGGCQGCSASSATLRQGVELEIKKLVPTIAQVVDVTDHSAGANPYYS